MNNKNVRLKGDKTPIYLYYLLKLHIQNFQPRIEVSHHQLSSKIRKEINQVCQQFKLKYPILSNQNTIGFLIFIIGIFIVTTLSILWLHDMLPTWIMVLSNAFIFGVLHELEHDLIHWMYFKNKKWVHHFMLSVIWLARPLTINPWIRRQLHYHHHKFSGTVHDVEERGVTNGEKWSLKRLIFTPDLVIGGLLRVNNLFKDIQQEVQQGNLKFETAHKLKKYALLGLIPVTIIAHILVYIFIIYLGIDLFNSWGIINFHLPVWVNDFMNWINPIIYIVLLPNVIRQFCLHFITSNLHYYGDVEQGNVVEQTQVLNIWWTLPLQVFCFFFGWTHAIHHFVVNETFYVRHFTRKKAHQIMKQNGVRFNDLGTFKRSNRFHETHA